MSNRGPDRGFADAVCGFDEPAEETHGVGRMLSGDGSEEEDVVEIAD